MSTKRMAQALYGLFGGLFLVAGAAVLSLRTGLLPESVRTSILDIAHGDLNTVHIMQEFGSLLVFTGVITFWFIRNYDRSGPFHWALTTFWLLFALVHWFDMRPSESVAGPLVNTIPLVLFALVGLGRIISKKGSGFNRVPD